MSFAATLIDDTNKDVFLGALSEESIQDCDIFIGIYEEETDTACGVMALSVMPDREEDDDRFALSVREIVIADKDIWEEYPYDYYNDGTDTTDIIVQSGASVTVEDNSLKITTSTLFFFLLNYTYS